MSGEQPTPVAAAAAPLRGYLYVVAAALLWSALGPWARLAYTYGVSPLELVFFRAGSGAVLAALWAAWRSPKKFRVASRSWPFFAVYGVVSIGVFYLSYFRSVQLNSVAVSAVLLYTAPVFVTVLSYVFFREPLTVRKLLALALALLGVALVGGMWGPPEAFSALGLAVGLVSGVTYGLYSIFGKVAVARHSAVGFLPLVLGFGALSALPPLLLTKTLSANYPAWVWLYLLAGGVFGTFVPYLLYTTGLEWVPASNASIVATIEPVAAAAWGWSLLGESLSTLQLLGGLLVLTAALLAQLRRAKRQIGLEPD